MAKLILMDKIKNAEYPIAGPLLIGRDEASDIPLADPSVSGKHARLSIHGQRVVIEDLDSIEGVRINGRMVQRSVLHDGDKVSIGDVEFIYRLGENGDVTSNQTIDPAEIKESEQENKTFGPFQIQGCFGTSQSGEVFQAINTNTQQTVALKIFKDEFSKNSTLVKAFVEKASLIKKIKHQVLGSYLEAGLLNGRLYCVMELVSGEPSIKILEREGPFSIDRVLQLGCLLCKALAHLNEQGLNHLDIRPMNILIGPGGHPKLVGLGVANIVGASAASQGLYQPGQKRILVGDPYYMAPEQHGGKVVGIKADIYSLGATLYHLLTGQPPFDGPILGVITKHKMESRPDARKLNQTIPASLAQVLQRMMAIEVEHRPSDLNRLADDFRKALSTVGPNHAVKAGTSTRVFSKKQIESGRHGIPRATSRRMQRPRRSHAPDLDDTWTIQTEEPEKKFEVPAWIAITATIAVCFFVVIYLMPEDGARARKSDSNSAAASPTTPSPTEETKQPAAPQDTDSNSKKGKGPSDPIGSSGPSGSSTKTRTPSKEFSGNLFNDQDAQKRMNLILKYFVIGSAGQKKDAEAALIHENMIPYHAKLLPNAIQEIDATGLQFLAAACAKLKDPAAAKHLVTRVRKNPKELNPFTLVAIGELGTQESRELCLELINKPPPPSARVALAGFGQMRDDGRY